jgi:hypothetical protein
MAAPQAMSVPPSNAVARPHTANATFSSSTARVWRLCAA